MDIKCFSVGAFQANKYLVEGEASAVSVIIATDDNALVQH